ncbi:MAG TPA: SRPBCC family protein [Gemmatimonadaceae bacterium]
MTESTPWRLKDLLRSKASFFGIIAGTVYGTLARFLAEKQSFGGAFSVMTGAFLFVVPLVLGTLTVSTVENPSGRYRIFAPWIPSTLVVLSAVSFGWEGSICVVLALPVLLVFSSIGGLMSAGKTVRHPGVKSALIVLPFALSPIETRITAPTRFVETVSEIHIAAPPSIVWPLIVSVDSIRESEQRPALFTRIGFPRPVSAMISGTGVGAIRSARFERGLVFTETVTIWEAQRRLSFTIDPNTESIPAATLDPHVTIGGPFFDVLTGTYELHPLDDGRSTRLVLRSRHRVSTRFNVYAGWWADRIMGSIQSNILEVHKARAERRGRNSTTN